jgi:hypothetical protein
MGGGGAPSSTTTTTKPFPAQERALTELFGLSQAAFEAGPQQFFPGQTVAGQSGNTLAGQQLALDAIAPQAGLGMAGARAVQASLDPMSAQSQAVMAPAIAKLQSEILPEIGSRAIQQGAFGGDRQRVQEQAAAEATAGAATQALLRNQMAGMSALGAAQQGLLAPATTASQVGAQQETYNQALINAARERFQFGQQAPETALDRLGSRISGIQLGQIGTSTTEGGGGSAAAQAAGAGLVGYGLLKG